MENKRTRCMQVRTLCNLVAEVSEPRGLRSHTVVPGGGEGRSTPGPTTPSTIRMSTTTADRSNNSNTRDDNNTHRVDEHFAQNDITDRTASAFTEPEWTRQQDSRANAAAPDAVALIMGDFNCIPGSPLYQYVPAFTLSSDFGFKVKLNVLWDTLIL